ncbi:MAG TPA: hypothetical protein VM618_00650, partial [Acidimicrobiia bacterium]|nr:hypothetical protein [Acidimicrobiia bacterium]
MDDSRRGRSRRLVIGMAIGALVATTAPAWSAPADELADAAQRFAGAFPGVAGDATVAPARDSEPVVLTGAAFSASGWAAPGDVDAHVPDGGGTRCQANREGMGETPLTPESECTHSTDETETISTAAIAGQAGTPVDRLVAFHWTGKKFKEIPLQVDEVFARYLSNNVSGFALYSNTDRHVSYAFDREGYRWTASHPDNPCLAAPTAPPATDPVPGLDTDDEVVFMARDAADRAPADADFPKWVADAVEVTVTDPYRPDVPRYAYVARVREGDKGPKFDATNGYVRYERDADADVFLFSESSYDNYGAAPAGPYFDPASGECVTATPKQRRPADTATVTTPRYRFRYDGRWLMTELQVSADRNGDWTYGADLVDQWKARAFQQRPGGQTPCCGFEEEVNNWGGSSILLGERTGPVRAIRETWGADSGTNVIRREVFYRDEIRQSSFLRVHPIPPLDGIYAQWDHAAGAVDTYYNPFVPDGVAIDGRNDEVFGNSRLHVGPDGVSVDGDDTASDLVRDTTGGPVEAGEVNEPDCAPPDPIGLFPAPWEDFCTYNDIDTADPLFSGANANLAWEQVSGPAGTLVTRWGTEVRDVVPGSAAHAVFALPYYRDDSCFDDGTGTDPGPHLKSRDTDDGPFATWTDPLGNVRPRECWDPDNPEHEAALGTRRLWQGSIGTHGLHLLLITESDNANTTLPVTEIDSTQRIVALPPTDHNV